MITRIEIEFALPVELSDEQHVALNKFLIRICDQNCPKDWAFWPAGQGSKPIFSQADSLFLGKPPDANAPEYGEPTWDHDVYHVECDARELYPEEIEKKKAKAVRVEKARSRWWVRILSGISDWLHKRGMKRCSWIVADFCFWLQDRFRLKAAS